MSTGSPLRLPSVAAVLGTCVGLVVSSASIALSPSASAVAPAASKAAAAPAAAVAPAAAHSSAASVVTLSSSTAALDAVPTQQVTYDGVTADVPADWPVIDLDKFPGTCVRLDQPVVYVGAASAQQNCPARLVGRADTVWLGPQTANDTADIADAPQTRIAGETGRVERNVVEAAQDLVLPSSKVTVRTTWDDSPALADAIVASTRLTDAPDTVSNDAPPALPAPAAAPQKNVDPVPAPPAPDAPDAAGTSDSPSSDSTLSGSNPDDTIVGEAPADSTATGSATVSPSAYRGGAVAAQPAAYSSQPNVAQPQAATPAVVPPSSERVLTGAGFDTCAAPTTSTMSAWRQSPYASIGIYIGGPLRACGDGNLSASWVSTVRQQGWGLVPIYVGYQAPCNNLGLAKFTAANAVATARSHAQDAVAKAKNFGLPAGSTLHYDMEYYPSDGGACSKAVTDFMDSWTETVHSLGYRSGVYGNLPMMKDLADREQSDSTFTAPDQIWFAWWNYLQDTNTTSIPSTLWANHQRQHQYRGDFSETWGGVTIRIDANWVDAPVAGNPVQTNYGTNVKGPGAAYTKFTGSMLYWRPAPGSGAAGKAYWTYTNGSTTESNGATWYMWVKPGAYVVDVNIPGTMGANGIGHYSITDQFGTKSMTLNQGSGSGYRRLSGTYSRTTEGFITIHLGDNEPTSTTGKLVADAARVVQVGGAPYSTTYASAAVGNGQATVAWKPPTSGWSPTGYRITASPGGKTINVSSTARAATMTGLSNGTAYKFSVASTSAYGTSASRSTNVVTPLAPGPLTAMTSARLMDTRTGTALNPMKAALAAGQSVTVKVAGTGSPIPAGARTAALNVTVASATKSGTLTNTGSGIMVSSFMPSRNNSILTVQPLTSAGTITLKNSSAGTMHLIIDAQARVSPSALGLEWSPVNGTKIFDSRTGTNQNPRKTRIAPHETVKVKVFGVPGTPVPTGAKSVALNLTVTTPYAVGNLAVGGRSSVVNFLPSQSVSNSVVTPIATDGTVSITNNSTGSIQLIGDVQGFSASSSSYRWTSVTPRRVVDTRTGTVSNARATALGAGQSMTVRVAGIIGSNVPSVASAVSLNITATGAAKAGWLTVDSGTTGTGAALNFGAGQTMGNASFSWLNSAKSVRITNRGSSSVQVIVDALAYATP